jgi:hypothetical protein
MGESVTRNSLLVGVRISQPLLRHQHGVFDADAAEAFQVHAGLDGDCHACFQAALVALAEARRLVDLESQAVAGGMDESFVEPIAAEHFAGGGIHCRGARAGADRVDAGELRFQHRLVSALHLGSGRAEK